MNWAKLILTVVTEAWDAWRTRKTEPDEPVASQRDIAIRVAAGEAARREGKIAADIARRQAEANHIEAVGKQLEDTWPGERK